MSCVHETSIIHHQDHGTIMIFLRSLVQRSLLQSTFCENAYWLMVCHRRPCSFTYLCFLNEQWQNLLVLTACCDVMVPVDFLLHFTTTVWKNSSWCTNVSIHCQFSSANFVIEKRCHSLIVTLVSITFNLYRFDQSLLKLSFILSAMFAHRWIGKHCTCD